MREEAPQGASFRWVAPCGDVVTRADDALVIEARAPIEGLDASSYRKSVLLFQRERFVLLEVVDARGVVDETARGARDRGLARDVTYKLRLDRGDNLYEVRGEVVEYDPDRHLEKRRERQRLALGFLVWVPLVPLYPLLGLLPQPAKEKLAALGVNPARATQFSLAVEWALVLAMAALFFVLGSWFTVPGFITGVLTLLVCVDIAYRFSADADNQSPGMFGVVGEFKKLAHTIVDTARGKDRLLPDDTAHKPDDAQP